MIISNMEEEVMRHRMALVYVCVPMLIDFCFCYLTYELNFVVKCLFEQISSLGPSRFRDLVAQRAAPNKRKKS